MNLIIRRTQLIQMGESASQQFIKKLARQIIDEQPYWHESKSIEFKTNEVADIINYGQTCNIFTKENLIKFTKYFVSHRLQIPLKPELVIQLKVKDKNEFERLESFFIQIENGRENLTLIEL